MKTPTKKTRTGRCEFCFPQKNAPELGKLPTATTIMDDNEHFACCVKCSIGRAEEKSKKYSEIQSKK